MTKDAFINKPYTAEETNISSMVKVDADKNKKKISIGTVLIAEDTPVHRKLLHILRCCGDDKEM